MTQTSPIVGTIQVIRCGPAGTTALMDSQRHAFPNLDAVFRTAIRLLDEKSQSRPTPPPREGQPLPLPGFAP
jgi:hypothetical protein